MTTAEKVKKLEDLFNSKQDTPLDELSKEELNLVSKYQKIVNILETK